MRKYFRTVPYRMMQVLVALVALAIPVEVVADCLVTVDLYNYKRRVPGEVNTECSWPHYFHISASSDEDDKYKRGFGNWGVNSHYGEVEDGFQFAGWYWSGGLRQWQSCTRRLPKPDCKAYNDNNCTGQKTVPEDESRYGGVSFFVSGPCNAIGVQTIEEIDMHIYELDKMDDDEPVASLVYGDVDVPLTCSNAWNCTGESSWVSATSNGGNVSSRAQARVSTKYHHSGR